jgi:hypothetical protein
MWRVRPNIQPTLAFAEVSLLIKALHNKYTLRCVQQHVLTTAREV